MPVPAREHFGALPDGTPVHRWTLTDPTGAGASASILSYGGVLQSLTLPDQEGHAANVVLGFDNLSDYLERSPYFGCVVGRFANRIAGGKLELDGKSYELPVNDGPRPNTLHGGAPGFGSRTWHSEAREVEGGSELTLTRTSPDGEEGFPGTLEVTVRYTLANGSLTIEYEAETSAPTVLNLTNHAHFNMAGEGSGSVLDQELWVAADSYLPVDNALIPLGGPVSVDGTPFDFRIPTTVGSRIDDPHPQLTLTSGYDHNLVLDGGCTSEPRPIASLRDPRSGRILRVATTEPGIQVYGCNDFDGSLVGTGGRPYPRFAGLALETQHFPDSPNRPDYPSTLLEPGEAFRSTTVFAY